jgi:Ca-activated chloride channel homolog
MRPTKAIVIVAGILILGAIVVARGRASGPTAPPPPAVQKLLPTTAPPSSRTRIIRGSVQLSAASSNRYVHASGGELYLDVSLAGLARRSSARRMSVNVSLVIDRSGSMAGKKLEDARAAAQAVLAQLSDGDRLAIVIYDDTAEVLVPSTVISEGGRARIRGAIRTIHDRGSTNLWGGLDLGRRQVLAHARDGFVNRVVLISDGLANVGISTQAGISQLARTALGENVHVTAMGVGSDFDANMMTSIAEHGGGHYYFIDDSSALAAVFSKELQTLLATVAKGAELRLELQPGVELLDVLGYTFERRGGRAIVRLPDLYSGLDRKVMCHLRVPAGAEGTRPLAKVSLAFTDVDSGARQSVETSAVVAVIKDQKKVEASADHEVLAKGEQAFAAKNLNRAMDDYDRGDVAGAQGVLRKQIAATAQLNTKLKSKALDGMLAEMRGKLHQTARTAPSSVEGKLLSKGGKFNAYKAAR